MHEGVCWSFGRPSLRWKVQNKIVVKEIVRAGVHRINLARMGKSG
jgi:hypothetical protein